MVTKAPPAARIAFLAAILAFAFALVPVAFGKGKPGAAGAGSSFTVALFSDQNGDGLRNWADAVTFSASTTATTSPSVKLTCFQGGVAVLWGQTSFYLSAPVFPLQSGMWTGGAA